MSDTTEHPPPATRPGDQRTSAAGPLSPAGTVRLVASREFTTRIRSKGYLLTTGLLMLIVVAGPIVVKLAINPDAPTKVAVTSATATVAGPLTTIADAAGTTLQVVNLPADQVDTAVRHGDVEVALTGSAEGFTVVSKDGQLTPALAATLTVLRQQTALSQAIRELGGDPGAVSAQIASSAQLNVQALEPAPQRNGVQIAAGYIAGILLFIALQSGGSLVAQGVVEEKTSRVVEVLLATIRPWQLMAGKVAGIGAIALLQIAAITAAGVGTALALGLLHPDSIDLGSAIGWALLWFIIGFAMYAIALAALASLVSRQEEVGSVITPVIMLMTIPYIIGISVAPWNPDSVLVRVLSYVPFCSPMLMPIRIALESVQTWQNLVSMLISLAVLPILVLTAGRIYSRAVLRTGARVSLREALRRN